MGIFQNLFKGKNKTNKSSSDIQYKEEWDFYFSNVNDIIGSLFVDLGLRKIAPLKEKPNLVWISIKMNSPQDDGLSSNSEYDILTSLEDRLVGFIKDRHNAIYVGRLTSNGKRDFYFYMGDTILYDKTLSEALVAFPSYEYDFVTKEEEDWGTYFEFLYPLPSQFQSIQNRRVLENLEKHGDPLTKERQVDHWIFFKTSEDRESFLSQIEQEGFNIVNNDYDTKLGEMPFRLHISRVDKVDYNNIDDYVLKLWKLAGECKGEYDGWETSVEKE